MLGTDLSRSSVGMVSGAGSFFALFVFGGSRGGSVGDWGMAGVMALCHVVSRTFLI